MASIALQEVSKTFANGQTAARDLTLEIADGELLVLLGPSGCGKSTVLRLIAGLETPSSGRILVDGHDVTDMAPRDRDLAMVFQNYALYPHKSVRENLAFALQVRHIDASTIEARVRATAATLGIDALLDRKPGQLSGGQRQRVALGRAIVREPRAFLLDEPLSNLDPQLRAGTRAELALLHRRLAATMVYVTHDQEEAMTLGTRVAVMRGGALEQLGTGQEVFRRPANAFVGGFLGWPAMNLWRGTCRYPAGGPCAVSPAFSVALDASAADCAEGRQLQIGARPHEIDLVAEGEGHGVGRVEIVEALGALTVVHLRVEGAAETLMRVVVHADARVRVGDHAGLRLRSDRLHVFDGETGRRLLS